VTRRKTTTWPLRVARLPASESVRKDKLWRSTIVSLNSQESAEDTAEVAGDVVAGRLVATVVAVEAEDVVISVVGAVAARAVAVKVVAVRPVAVAVAARTSTSRTPALSRA
jgi:hypothetical protein